MRQVLKEYGLEGESEYRDVVKVRAYLDDESFAALKDSVEQMERDHPSLRGIYEVINAETVEKVSINLCKALVILLRLTLFLVATRSSRCQGRRHSYGRSIVALSGSDGCICCAADKIL